MRDATAAASGGEVNEAAFGFVRMLAAELSTGVVELPAFPAVVERLRRALDDPRSTAEQLARIAGSEPALAGRLLTMANSAAFTATGKPVADLRTAITRLGNSLVHSAAVAFGIVWLRNEASLKSVREPLKCLSLESVRVAAICQELAKRAQAGSDAAFLAGLLHGIGKIYLWVRAASRSEFFGETLRLESVLEDWHASIGKAVLENWNVPQAVAEAVGDQDDRERRHYGDADLTDVLVCAVALAALPCGARVQQAEDAVATSDAFRQLRLDAETCLAVLEQAEVRVKELRAALMG